MILPLTIVNASDNAADLLTSGMRGLAFAIQMAVVVGIFYFLKFLFKKIFKSKKNIADSNTPSSKSTINHTKDVDYEIKTKVSENLEKYSDSNFELDEDVIYEQIMTEIEEDKKIKSTWAKALSKSDGDYKKAESLYINLRVQVIKDEKSSDDSNTKHEIVLNIHEREKEKQKEKKDALQVFLEKNTLYIIKKVSATMIHVNYNNTDKNFYIEYINGSWDYVD